MDNNKLYKVSKKYKASQRLHHWEVPNRAIQSKIKQILVKNNTKNNKNINKLITNITTTQILPRNLDINDFNLSFQTKKGDYLNNIYSNQLDFIQDLKKSISLEKADLRNLKQQVATYSSQLRKASKELDDLGDLQTDEMIDDKLSHKNQGVIVSVADFVDVEDNQNNTENGDDDSREQSKISTPNQLDKLLNLTEDISKISSKLDELNELI